MRFNRGTDEFGSAPIADMIHECICVIETTLKLYNVVISIHFYLSTSYPCQFHQEDESILLHETFAFVSILGGFIYQQLRWTSSAIINIILQLLKLQRGIIGILLLRVILISLI